MGSKFKHSVVLPKIISELEKLKFIEFLKKSKEEFLCPVDKFKLVQEMFFKVTIEASI